MAAARRLLAPGLIVVGALAAAMPAGAATGSVAARGSTGARCHTGLRHGDGVARRVVHATAGTIVVAHLGRGHGNWDLGIFDARGRTLGGAAVPGSDDLAQAPVRTSQAVIVQACRRAGASRTVGLTTTSVPFGGGSKRQRLQARRPDKAERLLAAATRNGRRSIAHTARAGVPSGRRGYRQLPDYEADIEQLVAAHPHTTREIVLPHPTLIGRRVVGIEIARDVHRSDGRPVLLVTGLHHSREWPSGEVAMEWAIDLVHSLARRDPTIGRLLARARVIAVPVVNPDGFFLSRTVGGAFEFKRKNCRVVDGQVPRPGQCEATANAKLGVDPNRNYGGFWGGPGASLDPSDDAYRGAAPFSEPESRNIRELISGRQVTVAVSNHTYGNLVLRPPSLRDQAPPDEADLKRLGDEIAGPAGLTSERGYQLYDTSGAMEDWSYWATGGLAFTVELGTNPPADTTGLSAFHPPYSKVASWYPALRRSFGRALAWAADSAHHAVISGRGPAGATVQLARQERTSTSPVLGADGLAGAPLTFPDRLRSSLRIGADGRFIFHANPSTPPAAMGRPGREPAGPATAPVPIVSPGTTTSFAYNDPNARDAPPSARVDVPFTIAPSDDDATISARISWADPHDDFDLYVVRLEADGSETTLGSSAQGDTTWEQATATSGPFNGRLPAGRYVARVIDYATADKTFSGQVTFAGPTPPVAATPQAWVLTCRVRGRTVASHDVLVARGRRADVGSACRG